MNSRMETMVSSAGDILDVGEEIRSFAKIE